jgi:prepilin-type N-terminal cleavage/methylation domain-containing protein
MYTSSKQFKSRGFTVVELLIVIIVIGILIAVGIVAYGGVQGRAFDKSVQSDADGVDGLEARYATANANTGKAWYSPSGIDSDLKYTVSPSNVMDIVTGSSGYCIRVYNPNSASYKTLATAAKKESSVGACDASNPSTLAQTNAPGFLSLVWTKQTNAGSRYWTGVATSSDGVKLVAIAYNDYIYTSIDSGATWTQRTNAGSKAWSEITSSSDGVKLVAIAYNDYIYTSVDSGATWTQRTNAGLGNGSGLKQSASSADGVKIVTAGMADIAHIYTSTNSGAAWTQQAISAPGMWDAMVSSTDGNKLMTGAEDDYIYTSTDGGQSWTKRTFNGITGQWYALASSADGNKLLAADYYGAGGYGGYVYTSTDGGINWTKRISIGIASWNAATSSADGSKLVVSSGTPNVFYTSSDSGATWLQRTGPTSYYASSAIVSSSDGNKLLSSGTSTNTSFDYLQTGVYR